uniref:Uncharacterized protein n=1 Tax=viral metagenome TaxID=1070528 RepID=A0A6M3IEN7_9ZZZZ
MAIKKEVNVGKVVMMLRDRFGLTFEEIGTEWLDKSKQRINIIYHKQKALSAPPVNVNSASSTNTSINSTAKNTL